MVRSFHKVSLPYRDAILITVLAHLVGSGGWQTIDLLHLSPLLPDFCRIEVRSAAVTASSQEILVSPVMTSPSDLPASLCCALARFFRFCHTLCGWSQLGLSFQYHLFADDSSIYNLSAKLFFQLHTHIASSIFFFSVLCCIWTQISNLLCPRMNSWFFLFQYWPSVSLMPIDPPRSRPCMACSVCLAFFLAAVASLSGVSI